MHADLVKLLDLQAQGHDRRRRSKSHGGIERRVRRARPDTPAGAESPRGARRAAAEGIRRRDELEARVESYRLLQERRQLRLEHVRNPKEAATLMAELDLARSGDGEGGERVGPERRGGGSAGAQGRGRGSASSRRWPRRRSRSGRRSRSARAALEAELEPPNREREESASRIDRQLRTRYDRLRRTRSSDVVVPLLGGTCGACHTSIPLNRRSQIRSGAVLDGCEGCGAILYPPEVAGSA